MSSPPPITNELFRFVSLRQPQLIEPPRKAIGFVHHPDLGKSAFFQDADNSLEEARGLLGNVARKYRPLAGPSALRALQPRLFDFAVWLGKHRETVPPGRLRERAAGIPPLSATDRLTVWDNLFYHVQRRDKNNRGQYCEMLLRADHLLRHLREDDLDELAAAAYGPAVSDQESKDQQRRLVDRLAAAAIVLPKAFSHGEAVDVRRKTPPTEKRKLTPSTRITKRKTAPDLNAYGRVARAEDRRGTLQRAGEEMRAFRNERPAAARRTIGEILEKFPDEFSDDVGRLLNAPTYRDATLAAARKAVSGALETENRAARDGTQDLPSAGKIEDYCHLAHWDTEGKYDALSLSIKLPGEADRVTGGRLSVTSGGKTLGTIRAAAARLLANRDGIRTYALLPERSLALQEIDELRLSGELSVSNGERVSVDLPLTRKATQASACPGGRDEAPENPGKDEDATEYDVPDTFEEWEWDESWDENMELYGVNHVGLGIFRRVEQEVCCYVPGEVARIENVMAREYRERSTRSFTSTESSTTEESAFGVSMETDTSVTTRNELKVEVAKVQAKNQDTSIGASAEVSGKMWGAEVRTGGSLGLSMGSSASESDREALLYAQDVVEAAAERVTHNITVERTERLLREYEEKNTHGYDNRAGDRHVTGVYRWIDIIYTNRLVNYGAMEMVEFVIPEPARFYRKVLQGGYEEKPKPSKGDAPEKPVHPRDYGITGPEKILATDNGTNAYYQTLAGHYGLVPDGPPPLEHRVAEGITKTKIKESTEDTDYTESVLIPGGYELSKVEYEGTINYDSTKNKGTNWIIACQGDRWEYDKKGGAANNRRDYDPKGTLNDYSPGITGNVKASFHYERTRSYTLNFVFVATLTAERLLEWQTEIYDDILAVYEADLAEYRAAREEVNDAREEVPPPPDYGTGSTATNRATEKREIKRQAIEMLTRQFAFGVGADYLTPDTCRIPVLDVQPDPKGPNWREYAAHVKFFEQVFDWELMSYLFYPYYWADRCDWPDLIQIKNPGDTTFEAFLQSGMARVVVPVRRGFERALNYYFQTGLINNGGNLVLDTSDDLYLSIDEELRETKGTVEKTWETRLPTALTIIQGNSVYLDDAGLPCCHDDTEEVRGLIADDALLGVVKD